MALGQRPTAIEGIFQASESLPTERILRIALESERVVSSHALQYDASRESAGRAQATMVRRQEMDEKTEASLRKRLAENERRIAQADEKARAIQDSVADLRRESRKIKARLRYQKRKDEAADLRAQRDELEAEMERLRAENASMRMPDHAFSRHLSKTQGEERAADGVPPSGASNSSEGPRGGHPGFAAPRLFHE
jgi:chromosome segregation ATPase